jgi:hypothetical protein
MLTSKGKVSSATIKAESYEGKLASFEWETLSLWYRR